MAIGNGTGIQPYNLVRMAELSKHFWTSPRSFDGQDEDHYPRTMDGDRQALYCSPLLRGSRRQEAQGNAPATVSVDTNSNSPSFDPYHTPIRPMTLSRVVTSSFLRMLFWKGVVEMATQEFRHYERVWDGLEDYEKAVKQNAEPKLLSR